MPRKPSEGSSKGDGGSGGDKERPPYRRIDADRYGCTVGGCGYQAENDRSMRRHFQKAHGFGGGGDDYGAEVAVLPGAGRGSRSAPRDYGERLREVEDRCGQAAGAARLFSDEFGGVPTEEAVGRPLPLGPREMMGTGRSAAAISQVWKGLSIGVDRLPDETSAGRKDAKKPRVESATDAAVRVAVAQVVGSSTVPIAPADVQSPAPVLSPVHVSILDPLPIFPCLSPSAAPALIPASMSMPILLPTPLPRPFPVQLGVWSEPRAVASCSAVITEVLNKKEKASASDGVSGVKGVRVEGSSREKELTGVGDHQRVTRVLTAEAGKGSTKRSGTAHREEVAEGSEGGSDLSERAVPSGSSKETQVDSADLVEAARRSLGSTVWRPRRGRMLSWSAQHSLMAEIRDRADLLEPEALVALIQRVEEGMEPEDARDAARMLWWWELASLQRRADPRDRQRIIELALWLLGRAA